MAAGRSGESEHRDGNSGNEVSRRKYSQSMCEYDGIKTGGTDDSRYRGHVQEITSKVRVRRDINKGDMSRGYLYDSSRCNSGSRSGGGGSRQSELPGSAMDQEAGELSSDSGSDEAIQSVFIEDETLMPENGPAVPVETKKRKFSPIVWDRDDKEVRDLSVSATSTIVDTHPRRPPLSKSILKSSDHIPGTRKKNTPIAENNLQGSEIHKPSLGLVSESRVDIAASEPQQHHNGHREVRQLEEDDCIPTRSISVSRWADASFSGKEGSNVETVERSIISVSRWADTSISGKEGLKEDNVDRRKISPKSESIGLGVRSKSLTPQLAELNREGTERNGGRPSEDEEGGYRGRSSSQSEHSANGLDTNNFMEIDDEEDYNDDTSLTQSCTESEDGKVSHGTPEPVVSPLRTVNMLKGCRSVEEFERLNKIDEGTYGVVYRAKDKKTGEIVALKKVKMEREKEGFPLTSLREINILLSVHHPSIVDVKEVVVGSNLDSIFMVMEYMEHDLKGLMEAMKQPFSQSEVKCLMLQLLKGIKYLHDNWVLHRDLKTSNLLFNNRGELKICDLGMARQYGSPLKQYTHLVVTLWYRAPELLLGAKLYSTAIDMWSLGCIMAELLSKAPLFNGKTEFDQLDKIFRILGTPNESIWPGFSKLPGVKVNFVNNRYNLLRKRFPGTPFTGSPVLSDSGFDLLSKLLTYDPEKRISAEDALNHPWFSEVPLPKSKEFMPTFPAQHAQDRRSRRIMKSPDPLEEQRLKELQQGQLGTGGLFG